MINDYGFELANVLQEVGVVGRTYATEQPNAYGLPIGAEIETLQAAGRRILYFPPGRYLLEARDSDWVCAQGCEWFFADGAVLAVDWGATLRVRGTIRAGNQQIFGLSRYQPEVIRLRRGAEYESFRLPPGVNTWPLAPRTTGGPPAGRIIIESDDIPLVRPEWWGALTWDLNPPQSLTDEATWRYFDSSDAFQGAINAACIERALLNKAPIPIVLSRRYQTTRTIEVRAPELGGRLTPVSLVWRGGAGIDGMPSVIRTAITEERRADPEAVLRLHPGVDFDLQDVNLQAVNNVAGCLDVVCGERDLPGRRGFLRRVTLFGGREYRLRIKEADGTTKRRMFVLDGCALETMPKVASLNGVQLDTGDGVMLRVSDTSMGTAVLVDRETPQAVPGMPRPRPMPIADLSLTPDGLNQSTCHLKGGSVMLDALMFHQNGGPRPSRNPVNLDEPDGQDVFLGNPGKGRQGTHLTVLQCESQSWWFFGRDAHVAHAHHTVLVGLAHRNANWADGRERAAHFVGSQVPIPIGTLPPAPDEPPSVVWRGPAGRCVMVGCRLDMSMVLDARALRNVFSVATTFQAITPMGQQRGVYQLEANMAHPGNWYGDVRLIRRVEPSQDASIQRLVPIMGHPTR